MSEEIEAVHAYKGQIDVLLGKLNSQVIENKRLRAALEDVCTYTNDPGVLYIAKEALPHGGTMSKLRRRIRNSAIGC
jgi:hypothetical protein